MPRYFLISSILLLTLLAAPALSAAEKPDQDDTTRGGGLVCRTVEVQQMGKSCDAACAKVDMICTGTAAMQSPEQGCGDTTITPGAKCRCCAVAR